MNTKTIYLTSLILFTALLFFIPSTFISTEHGNTILTISTFLFGIISGFYIVVTTTDYNSVKNILAKETAGWIKLYHHVSLYDQAVAKTLSALIDDYVLRTFDYEIIDYARSTAVEFDKILQFVRSVPLQESRSSIYENIQDAMEEIIATRQELTVLGTRTLSLFQWVILFALAGLVITSLYGLRTGELFFDIVTVLISSSIVLILLLIRDLDLYIWNEKTFGYDIFENVLKAVGQLPYYPAESIEKKRVRPTEPEYRVGLFTNFPKSMERKIEVVKR
ncbi:MAG: hypothetical protein Q8R12_03015 [bacterium]|nr:hypothetical protein [bacterium]